MNRLIKSRGMGKERGKNKSREIKGKKGEYNNEKKRKHVKE